MNEPINNFLRRTLIVAVCFAAGRFLLFLMELLKR